MRIEFRQSGGVAGILRPSRTIDTDTLPATEASRWHELVATANFFELPSNIAAEHRRDAFSYVVKVDHENRSHTVRAEEGAGSPALDRLLEALRQTPH